MRNLHNIRIIAVDHGYGNVKTANTITPTGIKAYPTKPIFGGDILEYAGTYYLIGEGHKEFIADKSMDEDYYILTLMAVARQYVADLFATLRRYEYNPDLMRLYIVGGGGCLAKHFGDYPKDRVTIISDLCATAKGYESLCFAQLQRKGQV